MSDNDAIFPDYIPESATTGEKRVIVGNEKGIPATPEVFKTEDLKKYGIAKPIRKKIIGKISYDPD